MPILQIEHKVPDFERWKQAFDDDPVHRQQSGVRRYRVLRPVGDPHYVMIELEFDTTAEAEAMRTALGELWGRIQGQIMQDPHVRIVEVAEAAEL